MKWIGKRPPNYVWDGDTWYNEAEDKEYQCDIYTRVWKHGEERIPFPPKAKIMEWEHESE